MNPRPLTDAELTERERNAIARPDQFDMGAAKYTLTKLWEARENIDRAVRALYVIDTQCEGYTTPQDLADFIDRGEALVQDLETAYRQIKEFNQ